MLTTVPRRPAVRLAGARVAAAPPTVLPVVAITVTGALLRAWAFGRVGGNPFYDAAVRSMGLSWHNFFFGAFEPGGQVAIDKAPADLWIQVLSVKLLGFSGTAVRLPEVIAGTLAIPLLYDLVRRLFDRTAGLGAAAALALLPTAILTAHSDTMDSVMMALDLLAAWLVVVGTQRHSGGMVVAAGAVVGLAFNTKLFEALIVVPALAVLMVMLVDGAVRRRAAVLGCAALAAVGMSLAWIATASLTPLSGRPWPIGSTDGSVWSAVFGYNGVDRLSAGASAAALKLDPPGPLRLLRAGGHDYAASIGTTLLAAILVGVLALAVAAVTTHRRLPGTAWPRPVLAGAAFFAVWLVLGVALVSLVQRLQPRYLEAVSPAVTGAVGIGVAALARSPSRWARTVLVVAAAALLAAGALLATAPAWAIGAGLAGIAGGVALRPWDGRRQTPTAAIATCALVAILAVPAAGAVAVARAHRSDAGLPSRLTPATIARLSHYLAAHNAGTGYELAAPTPFRAAPIVVHDARPVLILTNVEGRPLMTAHRLAGLIARGRVRYALLGRSACATAPPGQCAPAVRWALHHAHDVSAAAGVAPGTIAALTTAPPHRARPARARN
jgi:4-amino-4-deoxy-L-arabinose transferase-like glycosyltransferase